MISQNVVGIWQQPPRILFSGPQIRPEAYLGGALGHGPPFGQRKFFFDIEKKLENLVGPLLCMSTNGQRKFGPPFLKS